MDDIGTKDDQIIALQDDVELLRAVLAGWFAVVDGNPNAEAAELLNVWRMNWHETTRKLLTPE